MPRLSQADWRKTPYAGSEAKHPEAAILSLLGKYGVGTSQLTTGVGPHGRPAFEVRFRLRDKVYRVGFEVLDADAPAADRLRQVKRAVYYRLKSALETASVFEPPEQTLFAYLETADGRTVYDVVAPVAGGHLPPARVTLALPPGR